MKCTACLSWFFSGVRWCFFFFLHDCTKTFTNQNWIQFYKIDLAIKKKNRYFPSSLPAQQTTSKKSTTKTSHFGSQKKKTKKPKKQSRVAMETVNSSLHLAGLMAKTSFCGYILSPSPLIKSLCYLCAWSPFHSVPNNVPLTLCVCISGAFRRPTEDSIRGDCVN